MALYSRKRLLLAGIAVTACLLPIVHSLSIPPPPTMQVIRANNDSEEELTTTQDPRESDGFIEGLVLESDSETTDPSETGNSTVNDSLSGKSKPVLEVVDIVFRPFRPPSIVVVDFFRKSNSTKNAAGSGSSDEDDGKTDSFEESSEGNKGTTMPSTTTGSTNDGSTEADSVEDHGGIMSSISVDSDGRDNNDVTASRAQETNGIFPHKPVIGIAVQKQNGPASQMTSSSVTAQKQFSMDNEDIDDARKVSDKQNGSNDDGDSSSMPLSTNLASRPSPSKKSGNRAGNADGDNNERRKRETHQMGNISNEDHDESSSSKNQTGKFQHDDMTKSNNGDNVSSSNGVDSGSSTTTTSSDPAVDDNDMDDNGQRETSDGNKSGTVKIFLEILQLVPLSNSTTTSTTTSSSISDEESTPVLTTIPPPADDKEDTSTKTVVQSMKANSNQKISSANSLAANTTASEQGEGAVAAEEKAPEVVATRKRHSRSATTKEESEKKGNPSTSPTTSASPSSRTTSKPLTGKDAPAVPSPSANASAKKASTTSPDDAEGPPLENVTQPLGKSDDD